MRYLLLDIGSTFTKASLVDGEREEIVAQAMHLTTVSTDVSLGVDAALADLQQKLQAYLPASAPLGVRFWDRALLASSAAGGLKMVAVGLGRRLTAEAATRAALGAGARVLKSYAYELSEDDLAEIDRLAPDILLLAGGTNDGNRLSLLEHARRLARLRPTFPIVYAGNQALQDQVLDILSRFDVSLADNLMPQVNVLKADPARRCIRQIFMDRITQAKGLDVLTQRFGKLLLPTPDAVLQAARLLSLGTDQEPGLGNLLLADVGGATTDIHSVGTGLPTSQTISLGHKSYELRFEGLQEPLDKRTVEGDLGMRYSANSLLESVGSARLQALYPADYVQACARRSQEVRFLPESPDEIAIDQAMAHACLAQAIRRHVGQLRREFTGRTIYYLSGKDLSDFHTVIGTGGVLVHSPAPRAILSAVEGGGWAGGGAGAGAEAFTGDGRPNVAEAEGGTRAGRPSFAEAEGWARAGRPNVAEAEGGTPASLTPDDALLPRAPRYYLDQDYCLSAMGLLSQEDPNLALRMMKQCLKALN